MTSQYTLSAVKRENLGKRASKRYRRDNLVPAEIYGSKENKSVLIDVFELNKQTKDPQFYSNVIDISVDSSKIEVILKDIQRDPEKSHITHIDFLAVDMNKKINVNVPFRFINEDKCVGIKISGGILSHILNEIEITCLPKDIPENIQIDVADLEIGHSIHMSEIKMPANVEHAVTVDEEHDSPVVSCYEPKAEKVEDVVEASASDSEETPAADDKKEESASETKEESK